MEYELYHYGILGMKWGIRRYQNPDGSLTPAGRKRYSGIGARKRYNKDTSQIETRLNKLKWKKDKTEKTAKEIEFLETALKGLRELSGLSPAGIRTGARFITSAQINNIRNNTVSSDLIDADEKKFRELMTKDVAQLSTQDLQFMNNRIQAKNNYLSNTEDPVRKMLKSTANAVATELIKEYAKTGAKALISKVTTKSDEEKFNSLKSKDVSKLSTQDLQFMNNRIQAKNAYANNIKVSSANNESQAKTDNKSGTPSSEQPKSEGEKKKKK